MHLHEFIKGCNKLLCFRLKFAYYLGLMVGFLCLLPTSSYSQTTQTFSTAGNSSFTVPANVTKITVEAWGGGGGGGTGTQARGGGGGGAYAKAVLTVTPGNSYTVTVGSGGAAGVNGGNSYFNGGTQILAVGGAAGSFTFGAGGAASSCIGTVKYNGGNGAAPDGKAGGGGGGSAFQTADGGAGIAGGAGGDGYGDGGAGGADGVGGTNGYAPGGGGGGTGKTANSSGSGATGRVVITYFVPTKLAFSVQPSNASSNTAISPSVVVQILDASNNLVTDATSDVTLAIGTNPGSGTLSGTTTVAAIAGVATFSNLSIDRPGTGYTLSASCGTLTGATSNAFNITAKLAFTTQPSNSTGGGSLGTVVVQVQNASGTLVSTANNTVTLAIGTNPGSGTLSGTTTVTAVNGVATFSNLSIDKAGSGYTLSASSGALTGATSSSFDVTVGTAAKLGFSVQPTQTSANSSITPAVQVQVQDAGGNLVTSATNTISLTLGDNGEGATLGGTTSVAASGGTATFSNLTVNLAGSYTLVAASGSLTGATSSSFAIISQVPAKLEFSVQPSNTTAAATISPSVTVRILDASDQLVTGATNSVTLAIGTNPGSGTLSGTLTVAASSGIATFSNLSIDKAGTGYTLAATSSGLTGATSSAFNIVVGSASKLVFSTQPSNTVAGSSISSFVVQIQDAGGNLVTSATNQISIAVDTNPGSGTLSGTTTLTASGGFVTFTGLSINKTGTGYTLAVTSSGLTGATSSSFNITPSTATKLAFNQQPTNAAAAATISPAVTVKILDTYDNLVTSATSNITLAIGTNPGSGTLSGTLTVAASGGVATFSNLSINKSGTGYTLTASSGSLTGITSSSFNISAGTATKLYFSVHPVNTIVDEPITPAVVVHILDANDNLCTSLSSSVTIAIGTNPGGATLSGTTTISASGGIATFSNLSLNVIQTGYTLTVTSGSLTGATSNSFNIVSTVGTKLAFYVEPTNATATSTISPAVVVRVLDKSGKVVSSATNTITLAIGTNPGGGTLSGTLTVNANAGVASFSTLSIDKIGAGYTLTATSSGLTSATSAAFNITAGIATKLGFSTQPANTVAGATMSNVVVQVQDAGGNVVTSATNSVTIDFGTNAGGGTLSGTKTVNASSGVATFSGLSINKTGTGYTFTAAASGLAGATSSSFNITPGTATKLGFTVQPSNTASGYYITPAVAVSVLDALDNVVTSATHSITVAIGTNPSSGTLSGTATVSATSGVATFSNLNINNTGTGYTLTAATSGLTGATSNSFNIISQTPVKVVFYAQPSNTISTANINPGVTIQVLDANDHLVTDATNTITLAIGTNPGSGTLSGTVSKSASGGSATFSDLSIDKAGTGYTLVATSSGLDGATSTTFNITVGTASKLGYSSQPTSTAAGSAISSVVVQVQDAGGNLISAATNQITLAIGTNPGTGTLSGTTTLAASGGIATFSNLSINKTGTGYTLVATATSLTSATSSSFNITPGAASKLVFNVQPTNATVDVPINPAVVVQVQDANDNLVTSSTHSISVAIGNNPSGGTLSGTTTITASGGIATFSSLSINLTGTGYTLVTSASGLTSATSVGFNIISQVPDHLEFYVQPVSTVSMEIISPSVVVRIVDKANKVCTDATHVVTMAIGTNPSGGTIGGTVAIAASAGVATFTNLTIDKAGTGYTLNATTTGGITGAISTTFNITVGSPSKLGFSTQPSNTAAATAISPSVVVQVQDAGGNLISTASNSITLAIGTNPGSGSLSGTLTVVATSGAATFSNLSINKAGTGYTLTASASGLTGATSSAFNITAGTATKLYFSQQPTTTAAGYAITPAVAVQILDANDNLVTAATSSVTIAIGTNPSSGYLSGTTTVAASGGIATFSTLNIDKIGTGYTLAVTASGLTGATSNAFNIITMAPYKLAFSVQPVNTSAAAAITPAVTAYVLDINDQLVTDATNEITMAIEANPSSGTLSGTLVLSASGGIATFNNLKIDKVGAGYTLKATASGLYSATSSSFDITIGSAYKLTITQEPSSALAGSAISPAITVEVQDAGGNVMASATNSVTMAIGTNPGSGTLGGTLSVAASSGVATFSNLSINKSGTGYTLIASADGLVSDTSNTFNVSAGSASNLVFAVQPSNCTVNETFDPNVVVYITDAYDNIVTTASNQVTMSIGTNPGGGVLSGTTTVTASAGVATFTSLVISATGSGYTLKASSSGLTDEISTTFNIISQVPDHMIFYVQPTSTVSTTAISPAVVVHILDKAGKICTEATSVVTIFIGTNPVGGTLSGTLNISAISGVATFSDLNIDKAGTGYTLSVVTTGGVVGCTSNSFIIGVGSPSKLAFNQNPTSTVAGAAISPAVTVQVQDAGGNLVSNATNSITVAIGANPGSGTLSGTVTVAASSGVATFSNLSINKAGTGYTLAATATSLNGATSSTFNIIGGAAAKLAFGVQPTNTIAALAMSPAVTVQILDANDNLTTSTASITIAIGTNPSSATLSGTLMVSAVNGTATFSNLSLNKIGTGYTFSATSESLTAATSGTFSITPDASRSTIAAQPDAIAANGSSTSLIIVQTKDGLGNNLMNGGATITITSDIGSVGSVTDHGDGTYSAALTSTTSIGTATVDGATNGTDITGNVSVDFVALNSTLTYYPGGIINSSLVLWLDADDASTFTYSAEPLVKRWLDKSPANNLAAQGSSSYEPSRVASEINSRAVVRFDGTENLASSLRVNSSQFGSGVSLFTLIKWSSSATRGINGVGLASPALYLGRNTVPDKIQFGFGSGTGAGSTSVSTGAAYLLAGLSDASTATGYLNGTSELTFSPSLSGSNRFPFQFGRVNNDGHAFAGDLAEVVTFARSLNHAERIIIENYYAAKWGTTTASSKYTTPSGYGNQLVGIGRYGSSDQVLATEYTAGMGFSTAGISGSFGAASGDYLMAAHNNSTGTTQYSEAIVIGGTAVTRWSRAWYVQKTLAGSDGNVTVYFDFSAMGLNDPSGTDYSILYNASNPAFPTSSSEVLNVSATTSGHKVSFTFNTEGLANGYYTIVYGTDCSMHSATISSGLTDLSESYCNLTINYADGVNAGGDLTVTGTLTLTNGTLTIPSGYSLLATTITKISGNLNMERQIATPKGWRMISSPTTTTFSDLFDGNFVTQGFTGSTYPDKQPNLLWFDETQVGTTNMAWRQPNSLSDNIVAGRGYFYYVFNGAGISGTSDYYPDVLPMTLGATGLPNPMTEGEFTYTVTYNAKTITSQPDPNTFLDLNTDDSGWNLIGNPTTATLDWDAESGWTKTNLDNTIYIWDPQAGDFKYWNGSAGTLGDGLIPPFQAFWVKTNNASCALSFTGEVQTTGGTFYKSQQSGLFPELNIPLRLSADTLQSTIYVSVNENGVRGADPYDAYRLEPMNEAYLQFFTLSSPQHLMPLVINNLPYEFENEVRIPLFVGGFKNGNPISGTYTLEWTLPENWPSDLNITLMDNELDQAIPMTGTDSHTFTYRSEKLSTILPEQPYMPERVVRPTARSARLKSDLAETFTIVISRKESTDDPVYSPPTVQLLPVFPNPVSETAVIRFTLPEKSAILMQVFDLYGRRIEIIDTKEYNAGIHTISWDTGKLGIGTYVIRLQDKSSVTSQSIIKTGR